MGVYYALSINVPYGFIAMLTGIISRYSSNGNACAEEGLQSERANFLTLQIICLILYIPMCFAPILLLYVKGYDWVKEQYLLEDEEEDWNVPLGWWAV